MPFFVEIEYHEGNYSCSIHQGNPVFAKKHSDLQLGPDIEINLRGKHIKLGALIQLIVDYDQQKISEYLDERGQLELGQYLYSQIFGSIHPSSLKTSKDAHIDLRIVTQDEHIAQLPWVLLAHQNIFLSMANFSVSLSREVRQLKCALPDTPRILVIAPEPTEFEPTQANAHIASIEQGLISFNILYGKTGYFRIARTWREFVEEVTEFKPHVVYYYGHGEGNVDRSRLVFTQDDKTTPEIRPIGDFAQVLRRLEVPPYLTYMNCCSGDAGGFLGIGWQLGDFVPAVITNRTIAYQKAAKAQAAVLLPKILLEGTPPHKAMALARSELAGFDLSIQDTRWMIPTLHSHYSTWKASPPKYVNPFEHDPHWHLKLNRIQQYGNISMHTRTMLRKQNPKSLAYTWYGREGHGIDVFHHRLNVELRNELPSNTNFYEVRLEWPMELDDPAISFKNMFCQAFYVHDLEDIPETIRAQTRSGNSGQTLLYVRHRPVTTPKIINPFTLMEYVRWWDEKFVPLLKPNQFALLGTSFIVNKPEKFDKVMREDAHIDDLDLSNTVFRLLAELNTLKTADLIEFFKTHNIRLPRKQRNSILKNILSYSKGHYDPTISQLKKIITTRKWDSKSTDSKKSGKHEDTLDY